ncbi:MAG TPA: VOC family protein [Nocardioides sp.]|jgi:predicted 3-demethylubiquinone-9 3-methyltransferase (glyoxalase superfamily)|uniref:VOC family protein n=1 Tax=Nocardioides sp. TaxID=35761 RepID=UPI002BDD9421|nr:VOC family protein [Nocardioides sp.]HTW18082.1 VOC family protein [Nocardioides sp.]
MPVTRPSTTISPCLWFDDQLEQAAEFYTKIFPNSSVGHLTRYTESGYGEPGRVMAGEFTIDGMTFRAINGGPAHAGFTEAVSFSIACADQTEVDYYWDSLVDGGEESMCGWLKDRFGLSWQIVPTRLYELVSDPDPVRADAATRAMLSMRKIVVADLEAAADAVR